jgi:hypothetical protein
MPTHRLLKALGHLQLALAPPQGDGELLARFVTCSDEAAFAALVRRHGPMVLGVLARKAGSVLRGEAVGSWLYAVAYRTARHVKDNRSRRWAREKQVDETPHPEVQPQEAQDWRPLMDDELGRLPEKYRAPVVLCDLQGQSRREAARQLRLPDGTLSRRLAAGRRLLAERLTRRGVALSGGALAAALSGGAASAQVAAPLVIATAKAAVGHLAAVSPAVAILAQGVLRTMFLTKLKVVLGVVLAVVALGAGGVAYRSADAQTVTPAKRPAGKPQSELEALRRENELLKLNLEVVLEKVRAQENELRALRGRPAEGSADANKPKPGNVTEYSLKPGIVTHPYVPFQGHSKPKVENYLPGDKVPPDQQLNLVYPKPKEEKRPSVDLADRIEVALKRLLDSKDDTARRRALDMLGEALRNLREQSRQPGYSAPRYYYERVPQPK